MQQIDGQSLVREVTVSDLAEAVGKEITFCACVHKLRRMSGFVFVILRTGRYVFQSVYSPEACPDALDGICEGAYVEITGFVKEEPRANYGYEITLSAIKLLSHPKEEYPLHVSDRVLGCTLDTNLSHRSVALRHPKERAVFRIAEGVVSGFREFMLSQNFTEIHTPKICAAAAEGGANIFKLKYFGQDAVLAQSPQFYKQTCVAFFDRVFEIAPVYRAEKHNSARHLNEYVSVDFEMGFINSFYDVINMETGMLKYCFKYLEENYDLVLKKLGCELPKIDTIPCVKFRDAKEMVAKKYGRKIKDPYDLEPEEERLIGELFKEDYGSDFVFVTHYPVKKRPFYAMDDPEDPKYTLSFDLLFKGMEITTGGQRIHDYDEQVKKMIFKGLYPEDFESYLMLHKYGCPPHGGLGMGLDRLVMKLLDEKNIRATSMFPRDTTRLNP